MDQKRQFIFSHPDQGSRPKQAVYSKCAENPKIITYKLPFAMSQQECSDGNDILGPTPWVNWVCSVLGTKLMLLRFGNQWQESCPILRSNFAKRVSDWHSKCLIPWTKAYTEDQNLPNFAIKAMEAMSELGSDSQCPKCLHIVLLLEASKEILDIWGRGTVCNDTAKKVGEWFALMQSVAESSLFDDVSFEVNVAFLDVLQTYQFSTPTVKSNGPERIFFKPKMVFIQVAHLVYMCTASHQPGGLPSDKYAKLESSEEAMDNWEERSGSMFGCIFKVKEHGLEKSWDGEEWLDFNLPYPKLEEVLLLNKVPSPAVIHGLVIQAMQAQVQTRITWSPLTQHEGVQLVELNAMNDSTRLKLKEIVEQSKNNEKFRKSDNKKRKMDKSNEQNELGVEAGGSSRRKPAGKYNARAPTIFQRDIFLLGIYSVFPKQIRNGGRVRVGGSSGNFQFETLGQFRKINTYPSQLVTPEEAQRKLAEASLVILTEEEGKEAAGCVQVEPLTVTQTDEEGEKEKSVGQNEYDLETEEEFSEQEC